jgi:hypothetical protein
MNSGMNLCTPPAGGVVIDLHTAFGQLFFHVSVGEAKGW